MARKLRPDPFAEGSLKDIYQLFFGRLIFYKPESLTIKEWMDELFDIKHREISRFIVARPFQMPGLLYETANNKIQGIGYREVPAGAELWVRHDAKNPDQYDVEWVSPHGIGDQVFCLDPFQWNFVRWHSSEKEVERVRIRAPRRKKTETPS